MNRPNPSLLGIILGAFIGVLLIWIGFLKLLIITLLMLLGYVIGRVVESEELRGRIKEFLSLLFR